MRAASATSAASNTIFFIYSSLFFAVLSRTRSLPTQRRRPAPRPETVNRLGVLPPACPSRCSGGSSPPCERTVFVPRRARAGRTRVSCGGTQRVKEYYPTGDINRAVPGAQAGPKWASAARKKSKRGIRLAAAGSGPRPKRPVGVGLRHPRKPPARCPARRRRGYPPTAAATAEAAGPADLGRYPL